MIVMDAWSTKFESTWLESSEACREMDEHLAQLVGGHWNLRGPGATVVSVLATRCEPTAALLRTLGASSSNAIHCTVLLALLGELLICADEGSILRKETVNRFAGYDLDRSIVPEAMRLLRNAVCHPASAQEHEDETGIASFTDFVATNFKEETWVASLRSTPGELARREVAFFALRLVNSIGWERANRGKLKMKGAKRPHPR